MTLWHFTCDHGHASLGEGYALVRRGADLKPLGSYAWTGEFAWFTDLAFPNREALGLTSNILDCDRTTHRYRVQDGQSGIFRWTHPLIRPSLSRDYINALESAPGAKPMHWFVAVTPQRVRYDPLPGRR